MWFVLILDKLIFLYLVDHKHNFDKYNSSSVTDYGVGYDYASIMHYSPYAFSKNDKMTISPKVTKVVPSSII